MAKVRTRALSEVPSPPPTLPDFRRMRESRRSDIEGCMLALDASSAGEVELEDGESLSAVRSQLNEIAQSHDLGIKIWNVNRTVYFCLK